MKQRENAGSGVSSKKVVVNDLLCFVQNNLNTLNQLSICRLCEETYTYDDISDSFQELKDNVYMLDPMFNVYPNDDSKRETLLAIIMLFNSKACEYLQFVSTTCNMPRMSIYHDMLSSTCVLDELRDLKQLVKQQTEILSSGLRQLSNEFKHFKKEHGAKCRNTINDDDSIESSFDTYSLLPSLNHFVEKNDNIFAEVNDTNNSSSNAEDVLPISDQDLEKEISEVKDVVMVGRPSESLLPASMRRIQTKTLSNTKATIDVRSSIQQLPGKFHKKHSCKICGYAGNLTDVTRHMRTHTGERPFSCPFCSSKFSLRGNMIKHLARKHGTFLSRIPPGGKKNGPRKFAPKKAQPDEENLSREDILSLSQQNADSMAENESVCNMNEDGLDVPLALPELQSTEVEESEEYPSPNFELDIDPNDNEDDTMLPTTSYSSSIINDLSQASSAVATYNPMLHLQASQPDDAPSSSAQAIDRFVSNQISKKKHRCDICGYTSTASDVTRHKRTHTGERPFPCPVCDARFSLRGNMTKHVARMHPDHTA